MKVSGATVAAYELVPLPPRGVEGLRAPPPPAADIPATPAEAAAAAEERRVKARAAVLPVDLMAATSSAALAAAAAAQAALPRAVALTFHTKTWEALDDGLPTAGISSESYAASQPPPKPVKREPVPPKLPLSPKAEGGAAKG